MISRATLTNVTVMPCDVTDDAQMDAVFAALEQQHGGVDFVVHGAAYALREDLSKPFVETSREGFRIALDVSAYSLVALARRAALMLLEKPRRRWQHPDAHISRQ